MSKQCHLSKEMVDQIATLRTDNKKDGNKAIEMLEKCNKIYTGPGAFTFTSFFVYIFFIYFICKYLFITNKFELYFFKWNTYGNSNSKLRMFLAILAILIYILPYTISSILDSINASNGVKIGSIIFTSLLSIGQFFASYTKIFPNIKTIGPVILRWLLYYTFLFVSSVLINYISVFFLLVGPLVLIMIYNLYKLYKCNPNNLKEYTSGLLLPFSDKSVSWDKLISPIYT